MKKSNIRRGQKIFFIGERLPYKVKETSTRYAICVRKMNRKEDDALLEFEVKRGASLSKQSAWNANKANPVYTIIDFKEQIRGTDDFVFGIYNYFDNDHCKDCIDDLKSGDVGISKRNRVELKIDWERTV